MSPVLVWAGEMALATPIKKKRLKKDKLVKSKGMLGFVPQPNLQVTVINKHPNYSMGRLIANPIFYERIKDKGKK